MFLDLDRQRRNKEPLDPFHSASKNATDGLWELIKGESLNKGVKIHSKDNELNIELYIIVEYGTKISVVANNIIQKISFC